MISKTLKNGLLSAALVGGALFSAGQAAAASYSVSLDPAFGGTLFTNLSWEAKGVVDIPDLCLATDGPLKDDIGDCFGTKFTSMFVTFYETNPSPSGLLTQTFDVISGPQTISQLTVSGNQLTGISAGFFGDFGPSCGGLTPGASCPFAGNGAYTFVLTVHGPNTLNNNVSGGTIYYARGAVAGPSASDCASLDPRPLPTTCGRSTIAPTVTITRIPEPETYALMLAGLAALGLTARRRRKV